MQLIKIETTDIVLQVLGESKGKIIVSDSSFGDFSYYWGSMGKGLESFLCSISASYFAKKLCTNPYVFSGKETAKGIRKYIKEELSHELPWYKYMQGQKELRQKIKEIESIESSYEALDFISRIHNSLDCFDMDNNDRIQFLGILEDSFTCEPWHFLENVVSSEYKFLYSLHAKLKRKLEESVLIEF